MRRHLSYPLLGVYFSRSCTLYGASLTLDTLEPLEGLPVILQCLWTPQSCSEECCALRRWSVPSAYDLVLLEGNLFSPSLPLFPFHKLNLKAAAASYMLPREKLNSPFSRAWGKGWGATAQPQRRLFFALIFGFQLYILNTSRVIVLQLCSKASHLRLFSATVVLWLGAWLLGVWIKFGSKL